jgi:hypothetical protein
MPEHRKFSFASPGAKDLGSSDAETAYYNALRTKVLADEEARKQREREEQRRRSVGMGLPAVSCEGMLLLFLAMI